MKRVSKVTWLTIGRAQRGWTAEVQGAIEAHTQCTWRRDAVAMGCHRWLPVAMALAFVDWRRKVREMRAEPGPFNHSPNAPAEARCKASPPAGCSTLDDCPTCARCDCSVSVRDGDEWEQGIDVCDHCAQEQAHTSNAPADGRAARTVQPDVGTLNQDG